MNSTDSTYDVDIMGNNENGFELFPYQEFKPSQEKIMREITSLSEQQTILIEAATGSGKTIASLTSLLTRKKPEQKIMVFVKTITQMDPLLREWEKIVNNLSLDAIDEFSILPVLGKNRLCGVKYRKSKRSIINCDYDTLNFRLKKKLKRKLEKRNRKIKLLYQLNSYLLNSHASIQNFKNSFADHYNCPYHSTQSMLKDANIIVTTYAYLDKYLFSSLLKKIGVLVQNVLILIDEAHNLAFERSIELLREDLELGLVLVKSSIFQKLKSKMYGVQLIDLSEIGTKNEWKELKKFISKDHFNEFDGPEEIQIIVEQSLLRIKDFFRTKNKGITVATSSKLVIIEVLPKLSHLSNANLIVFQSATMTPMKYFRDLFGLEKSTRLLDLVERDLRVIRKNPKEFRASYVSAVTSKARFRNEWMYNRIVKIIKQIFDVSPRHVLVLTPSYDFADELEDLIKNQVCENIVKEKPTSSTNKLHDDVIKLKSRSIILGNQRGKILEGNEWVRDVNSLVSTVVFTGLSFNPPREEEEIILNVRTKVLGKKSIAALFDQQIPMIIRAKQALGRCIRGRDDKGAIIILDQRADEFLHYYLGLSRYRKLDQIIFDLEKFFTGYSPLQKIT